VQPGRKRRVAAEPREPAMGADKGVLGDFLGVGLVVQEPVGDAVNPVWSNNSCGLSVIEFQEPTKTLAGLDLTG
jgi:hypothetical protein